MIAEFNATTLQKQVGCFNHGVVILAAYRLEIRDSDYERFALI